MRVERSHVGHANWLKSTKKQHLVRDNLWWLDDHDERCVPGFDPHAEGCRAHCRAVRKCVLNAPCEKERCTAVRASKVYHPMALKTCVE